MADFFRTDPFPLQATLGPPMSTRLEPQSVSGDPATGLRAQVWDPLWLVGRQWQLGELVGEDTGTPLTVRVRASAEPLVAWRPGPSVDAGSWRALPAGTALDELVDAEAGAPARSRDLALAGWALLDTLEDLGEARAADVLRRRFPAAVPASGGGAGGGGGGGAGAAAPRTATVPDTWSPVAASLAGRGIDPLAVLEALDGPGPVPGWWRAALRRGTASRDRADKALAQWISWVRAEVLPDPEATSSWLAPRLEHEFAVATATRVLRAPAHPAGEVSWATFDVETRSGADTPPPSDAPARALDRTLLATPLGFPGMPTSRFWELEDARVDLGSVWADPHELARLLVVECAVVHGGDWVVVPVDVPAGSVVSVESVEYTDTFGTVWTVDTSAAATPRWRMFTVTPGASSSAPLDGLVVPPASAGRLVGAPLEDVGFVRDESANLVWAVEHVVPGPGGDPVVPRSSPPAARPAPAAVDGEAVLDYVLMTEVPETWVPYLPRLGSVDGDDDRAVSLVRGVVARYDGDERVDVEPAGTLLTGPAHRAVESAEVPREGVRVQRVPVVARRGDGSWATWVARRVLVGRGEAESGLRTDLAVRRRG
ncbi:hypothetical protein ACK8HX_02380 [Oryzobacter sp. R7]|uniref:hypothetical protein n=1 Tax=Oryzobacter faecalis TaxID=3388656 RepID=UPI00398CB287